MSITIFLSFLCFGVREFTWTELFLMLRLVYCSVFYRNTPTNQRLVADLISKLGIIPVKLCQWMGYFLKIKYEQHERYQLILDTLPYLQAKCDFKTPLMLETKIKEYKHIIKDYDKTPISAASIAQIYKGTTYDGKEIAIKIKHDGIEENIKRWEKILKRILNFVDLKINLEHFFKNIRDQVDLQKEGENLQMFFRFYRKNKSIRVPGYITGDSDILVMEFVPSENFMSLKKTLSEEDVDYYTKISRIMYQDNIFIKDIIHMDLHNGNWGVDVEKKQIVLYDFGWVLKNQSDFKRFFILMQVGRYGSMEFFLKKYELSDRNNLLRSFVNEICEDRTIDTLYGIRLVLKMFPNEFIMDNFMFCVLSLCVFISSLTDQIDDPSTYVDEQIQFMEKHQIFLPLCTLMKHLRKPETREQLEKWCTQIETSENDLSIIQI